MSRFLARPRYIALAAGFAMLVYAFIAWIPLTPLLVTLLSDPTPSAWNTISQLLINALIDLAPQDALYAVALALLIGLNTAMLVFFYRLYKVVPSKSGISIGTAGSIAGLLGLGCAA